MDEKKFSRQLVGKTVVSKGGKKFGVVGDLVFEVRTGELLYIILKMPTAHAGSLDLEKTKEGDYLIPYSSVISISDFLVIAEEDIV